MNVLAQKKRPTFSDMRHTELGMLPADWRVRRIEDFATIATGERNTQDRVEDGLYPFYVRSQNVERINSYSFDGEAVLTAGDGVGTGKIFHYINGKCDIHQRVYRISDFASEVNGYFFYLFFSTNFYGRIMQMTAKSSVDSVRREMISRMLIALPSRKEQDAIADVLSDADAQVASLEMLIEKKRAIKLGTMQELLLGRKRLSGFSVPWAKRSVRDFLSIMHGKSQAAVASSDGPYPIFATGGKIGTATAFLYDKPSVLIGRKGTIDRPQFIESPFWTVDTLFYSVMKGGNSAKFFFYRFELIDWYAYNEASGVPSLNARTIEEIELAAPDPEEQLAIVQVLSDMDEEIGTLERRLVKARQIKQGAAQVLLTGRVRLI